MVTLGLSVGQKGSEPQAKAEVIEPRKGIRRSLIRQLLGTYGPENTEDVHTMVKDLLGDTLQEMLEAELDEELGYTRYDYKNKETANRRNGHSKKNVTSSMGKILSRGRLKLMWTTVLRHINFEKAFLYLSYRAVIHDTDFSFICLI